MLLPEPVQQAISVVTENLIASGATAIVVTGSYVRGTAGRRSDLDVYAIGDGPLYRLERLGSLLVSISWRTEEAVLAEMRSPSDAGAAVPGWREAIPVFDPDGIASRIIASARSWTWDEIGADRINAWLAEEFTGYTEEVHKLATALERGDHLAAAILRSLLAIRLPLVMSVHLRLLYASENDVWNLVADALGPEWERMQRSALALDNVTPLEACIASASLFLDAYRYILPYLDVRQRGVVDLAVEAIKDLTSDRFKTGEIGS